MCDKYKFSLDIPHNVWYNISKVKETNRKVQEDEVIIMKKFSILKYKCNSFNKEKSNSFLVEFPMVSFFDFVAEFDTLEQAKASIKNYKSTQELTREEGCSCDHYETVTYFIVDSNDWENIIYVQEYAE